MPWYRLVDQVDAEELHDETADDVIGECPVL